MTTATHHEAYADFFEQRMTEGWSPYLLTFMFDQMRGDSRAVQHQQLRNIEKMYGRFVTRVVHRPAASSQVGRLPIWVCPPDFPVFKHRKDAVRDVVINNGQHVHGVAVLPPWSRHAFDMADQFRHSRRTYLGQNDLSRVHAERITHDLSQVCEYATKMIRRGRVDPDPFLVLPRTRSEVQRTTRPAGRSSSVFG